MSSLSMQLLLFVVAAAVDIVVVVIVVIIVVIVVVLLVAVVVAAGITSAIEHTGRTLEEVGILTFEQVCSHALTFN